MAYKLVILDEAKREEQDIVDYLVNVLKSPQAAAHFLDELDYQLGLIADNPQLFALSRVPELAQRGYRTVQVNNYIMLYKTEGDLVIVAHLFHQIQDYARLV
ncbi:type II toxin-antitoxin system RelE/ParE family toxin [Xiamenia xianingshaonis]|uniref:type II toxin-antitoxin system RelE/ParE family toxin n=1 Tax=Xiamenia xianingshaonis TaxID=2682776 RepID=UPI00140D901D|nr:type II toxin-antitoxin system RelE/ParE family toxin [Xiamenia xianingshaonis]